MIELWKWLLSYWQYKRVVIVLPEFMYEISFYRGKIHKVKKDEYKPSGQMLYQVWYDEEEGGRGCS